MTYTPRPPPIVSGDTEILAQWLMEELRTLAQELQAADKVQLGELHVAPPRPREGMIVNADGTDWDPGSGAGAYVYSGGVWVWLGQQAQDLSGYLTKADNLNSVANKATSRSNLGVAIGTDVLAYDAQLTSNIRQNNQNGNYTLVATDAEKHLYYNSGAGPYTWTIPANSSVAFPIGTTVSFINLAGGPTISIAITTDTLYWAGAGLTGTRTLANYGVATAIKFNSVGWIISGTGLA